MEEKKKMHYAWWIMIGCCFMQGSILGNMMNAGGTLWPMIIAPVEQGGIGIGQLGPLALYLTIYFITTSITYPFSGRIIASGKIRLYFTICIIVICLAQAAMGFYTEVWMFYITGAIYGIAGAPIMVVASTVLVTNWFDKKRGLALGISQCFSGIGGAIFPLVSIAIAEQLGWRMTYPIIAMISLVLTVPWTAFVFRAKPEEMGLKPYGYEETAEISPGVKGKSVMAGISAKLALASIAFWAIFFYQGIEALMSGYNAHMTGFTESIGLGMGFGASMLSLSMIGYVFATLIMGPLVDKYGGAIPTYITLGVTALTLLGFAVFRTEMPLAITAFIFGMNSVIVTISAPTLLAELFGRKDFAKLISYTRMSGIIASFGASSMGFVKDLTGSFIPTFYGGVVILAICAVLVAIALSQKKKLQLRWEE